jgi:nitrate reductase gamma subunit
MAGEIFTFHALLRRNRALWAGAFLFHVSLAACAVGLVLFTAAATGPQIAVAGLAGLFACTAYLVLYRLGKRTARKISTPVEFANLGLFLVLSGAGLLYALTSAGGAEPVRVWLRGLTTLHPGTIPTEAGFPIALLATEVFLVYFPFSRMIHMVSKWFAFHKVNWE